MIREATIEDIPELTKMANDFHKYAIEDKGLKFLPTDFVRYCIFLMESPAATIIVLSKDEMIVGGIAGLVFPWFMDFSQLIVTEQWWWVDPDHRKGRVAFDLLDSLSSWGKGLGATQINMISIGSDREETIKKYYGRKGFTYLETHFIKEI